MELPLVDEPVGVGEGVGDGAGDGEGEGEGDGDPQGSSAHCAEAGRVCSEISTSASAAMNAIEASELSAALIMVSARTARRWRQSLMAASCRQSRSPCKARRM